MTGLLSSLNTAEERPSDYAHINRESESRKAKTSNFERKTEPNMQGLWDNCRQDDVLGGRADCGKTGTAISKTSYEESSQIVPDTKRWAQASWNTVQDNYSSNLHLDISFSKYKDQKL